ncbi:MAG: pyridoxamine 5'-phosphate oxidase [Pseudomonadota bacterium]
MIDETADPFDLFEKWFKAAEETESVDPNAMTVATVDADGTPNARILLLKGRSRAGFVFYTNLGSVKGQELQQTSRAALLFHWKTQKRQVRMRGAITQVTDAVADAYFATRPRESQLGAWASKQSQPLDSRDTFEARLSEMAARFEGQEVPRPPHWSGFQLTPEQFEFWQDREFRLHDRVRYTHDDGGWNGQRLYP